MAIKITKKLIDEIYNTVLDCLGTENVEGLFVSDDAIFYDAEIKERPIVVNFGENVSGYVDDFETEKTCVWTGMTKLVISPAGRNYVIKLPFTGSYYQSDDGIKYRSTTVDEEVFCREDRIYDELSKEAQSLIAPNIFVTTIGGLPIYIQEKIVETAGQACFDSDSLKNIFHATNGEINLVEYLFKRKYMSKFSRPYLLLMLRKFGIQKAEEVYDELTLNIDDLHCGNYGLNSKGEFVIIDIGGYDSSRWSDELSF